MSVEDNSDTAYKVKEFMRCEGMKTIQQQLGEYIKCLKEGIQFLTFKIYKVHARGFETFIRDIYLTLINTKL